MSLFLSLSEARRASQVGQVDGNDGDLAAKNRVELSTLNFTTCDRRKKVETNGTKVGGRKKYSTMHYITTTRRGRNEKRRSSSNCPRISSFAVGIPPPQ